MKKCVDARGSILMETKFCKCMKLNSASPDIFSLLIAH